MGLRNIFSRGEKPSEPADDSWKSIPGRHGAVYIAPDSCSEFSPGFFSDIGIDALVAGVSMYTTGDIPQSTAELMEELGIDSAEFSPEEIALMDSVAVVFNDPAEQ